MTRLGSMPFATGQNLNLPSAYLQNLQNYSQSSTGFT
jgi:hypothetical protein